eukprot:scaffold108879_cov22-Tisochrysis_lutea.AAC.2
MNSNEYPLAAHWRQTHWDEAKWKKLHVPSSAAVQAVPAAAPWTQEELWYWDDWLASGHLICVQENELGQEDQGP